MEQDSLLSIIANDKNTKDFLCYFWLKIEGLDKEFRTEGTQLNLSWQDLSGFFKNDEDFQRSLMLLNNLGVIELCEIRKQERKGKQSERLVFSSRFSDYAHVANNDLGEDKYLSHDMFAFNYSKEGIKNVIDGIKLKIRQGDFWGNYTPVISNETEKIKSQRNKLKNKFPYKLPAGTRWENITLKFENREDVFIKVREFEYRTNYKDMGFLGRGKDPAPSEAWALLSVLAKVGGELDIKDREAKTKYKKQKEVLSNKLMTYFGIDFDPFYPYQTYLPYKDSKSYKIRMTLIASESI